MTDVINSAPMERNLRLIPVHQALSHAFVWIPVFVLFSRARFDLQGAALLQSMYYLFVVVLEVPSGWISDRFGRVMTLRVAGAGFIAAHLCFIVGDDRFAVIGLGQFFLAVGFASLSGTDVSFHYDTLESIGRQSQYARRQARVASIGFTASALSAVLGGALGLIELRLAFVASLLFAVGQLALTLQLREPPSTSTAELLWPQLRQCVGYLRHRYVGWIFFYGVVLVTLEHVASSFMQPWLTEVLGQTADDVGPTPFFAGVVAAAVALVGAAAARVSAPAAERFGTVVALIGLAVLSAVIVSAMAIWVSAGVLVLLLFRSAQGAAAPVLMSAAIAPRTEKRHRATFLSINSLAGRLGYGLLLLFVSRDIGDDVGQVLRLLSLLSWILVAVLIATAFAVVRPSRGRSTPARGAA